MDTSRKWLCNHATQPWRDADGESAGQPCARDIGSQKKDNGTPELSVQNWYTRMHWFVKSKARQTQHNLLYKMGIKAELEDLLQELCEHIQIRMLQYRPERSLFGHWFKMVVKQATVDLWRHWITKQNRFEEGPRAPLENVDRLLTDQSPSALSLSIEVKCCLARLKPRHRQVAKCLITGERPAPDKPGYSFARSTFYASVAELRRELTRDGLALVSRRRSDQ